MPHPAPTPPRSFSGPLSWLIAWRFLRGRRTRLLDGTARAAIVATTLGVTAMIIAMALMTGYRDGLERQLVGGNSAILLQPLTATAEPLDETAVARLEAVPEVLRVGRVAYGNGVLTTGGGRQAEVTLRGVDPGGAQLAAAAEQLAVGRDGVPGVVLGGELADTLGVEPGDAVRLVALGAGDERLRFRYQSLTVTGTFDTGFAEFDAQWAVLDRDLAIRLLDRLAFELYEVTVEDPQRAPEVAEALRAQLGTDWLVTDWRELNRELFTALEVQQRILFLVLGLIVLVSTFNVASTLVVLVRERMRDIGVLAALGLSPRRLRHTFLLYGVGLGAVGIALGVAVGAGAAYVLDHYELIRFNQEVAAIYFIRSVPFHVEPADLLAVVGFAAVVNLLACFLPSRWAASMDPSRALRYE